MGFAAVARVTETTWLACAVRDEINFGLKPGGELKLETTICNEIRQHKQPVIIDEVALDSRFINHHTPAMYGFQSYISVPIMRRDGSFFGTLCAIDPKPARLDSKVTNTFRLFVDLISFHLQAIEQLETSEQSLTEERQTADLREQFIAILGHDLRNPLSAVASSAELLLRAPLDPATLRLASVIKNSSYRMSGLITNVLDFTRGRLGGGFSLVQKEEDLAPVLEHVISEMRLIWPGREIIVHIDLSATVYCDGKRIAQLFSNLLGNALNYGKQNEPVEVHASDKNNQFTLSVINGGDPIPPAVLEHLFKPYYRSSTASNQEGLGLGLYIAAGIAAAHSGFLTVSSEPGKTIFTLKIPGRH